MVTSNLNTPSTFIRITALLFALFVASIANAQIRTWDFAVTITENQGTEILPIGAVLLGSVSVDETGIPYGVGVSEVGLVTALDFEWNDFVYDESTANTGYLEFNPDGSLFALSFGNNCNPGGCSAGSGREQWFLVIGSIREGDQGFDFAGHTVSGISVLGDMAFSERTSDPIALLEMLGGAVQGVGPGNSLENKINLAISFVEEPDYEAACMVLTGFVNQVSAQSGKKIEDGVAAALIDDARLIMQALECI